MSENQSDEIRIIKGSNITTFNGFILKRAIVNVAYSFLDISDEEIDETRSTYL